MYKYTPQEVRNREDALVSPGKVVYKSGAMTRVACPSCNSKISIYIPPTSGRFVISSSRRSFRVLEWTGVNPDSGNALSSSDRKFVELHIHP